MKKFLGVIVAIIMLICGGYLIYKGGIKPYIENGDKNKWDNVTKELLLPGGVFEPGNYIEVDGVEILYTGEYFLVKNNRTDLVRVSCTIVGVKKDGTYDTIQTPSFVGVDKTQYEKDKAENGWAIKHYTNLVRPDETLEAYLTVYDFSKADSSYPKNDIDGDGYLDILFTISPQLDETSITVSTKDVKSEIYKIKD